jgi:DNA mismatch repair protein MutS2
VNADAVTAERIGLTWLRAALAPVGAFGRRHDESIAPYGPGDEARALAEIAEVVALADRLDRDGVMRVRAALRAVPEPAPIVARARAGDPLTDVDFYELGRFADALDALARAWDAALRRAQDDNVAAQHDDVAAQDDDVVDRDGVGRRPPVLRRLRAMLAPGRQGGGFYLDDAFAPGLRAAREALLQAEAEYDARREAIAARVRDAVGVDPVGEEFVVLRDVYAGPLPEDVLVVRETPTYRVAAIRVVAPQRDDALARLATEEEAARRTLAERIVREADAVAAAARALGALDRMLARVAFTQRWGGCVPELVDDLISFAHASFAPLAEALAARGRRYTPLSLDLRGVAVLTGPNMGGKSAALATAGFVCACSALGVPPPAREALLPLLGAVEWIGGEGPEDRARLLSSYAAEVVRAKDVLAAASPRTLVLVDEFARTTGPREGRALLIAFVEALRERRAFALVATHFDHVAEVARVPHLRIAGLRDGALNAVGAAAFDAALDAINAAMDYRVVRARDGGAASDALALAHLLGLDDEVVARARALYDD